MKLKLSAYEEFAELYRDYYGIDIELEAAAVHADNLVSLILEINTHE